MLILNASNITFPAKAANLAQYVVVDRKDGLQATRTVYATKKAATKAADRLDNAYGAYRYSVKAV
jgi:hypothetical protein